MLAPCRGNGVTRGQGLPAQPFTARHAEIVAVREHATSAGTPGAHTEVCAASRPPRWLCVHKFLPVLLLGLRLRLAACLVRAAVARRFHHPAVRP